MHKNLIGLSIDLDRDDIGDIRLNVPPEYWTIDKYRATLGHKVNHSFKKMNAAFGSAIHPRFGPIRTLFAIKDIIKGEELFVDYAYGKQYALPIWFRQAYKEEYGKPFPGEFYYNETNKVDIYQW